MSEVTDGFKKFEDKWMPKADKTALSQVPAQCDCYVPYGPEWEKAMMRMTKREIIDLFRSVMAAHNASITGGGTPYRACTGSQGGE